MEVVDYVFDHNIWTKFSNQPLSMELLIAELWALLLQLLLMFQLRLKQQFMHVLQFLISFSLFSAPTLASVVARETDGPWNIEWKENINFCLKLNAISILSTLNKKNQKKIHKCIFLNNLFVL